jgi:hypothetical protein
LIASCAAALPARRTEKDEAKSPILTKRFKAFCICLACSILVNIVEFSPVPTSAIIALIVSLLGSRLQLRGSYSLAAYAGSFGGIGKIPVNDDVVMELLLLAVFVSSVVLMFHYLKSKQPKLALLGLGGRLGFFGFAGFTLFSYLILRKIPAYHDIHFDQQLFTNHILGIFSGAAATTAIRRTLGKDCPHKNVFASAIVGTLGSFALMFDHRSGNSVASTVFLGSFIGMSELSLLQPGFVIFSSVIAAAILVIATSCFAGYGGLLGTVALCGVWITRFLGNQAKKAYVTTRK